MTFLFAIAALLSTHAHACPDLAGHWSCQNERGESGSVVVEQSAIEGGMLYSITSDQDEEPIVYIADGKTYSVDEGGYFATFRTACNGDSSVQSNTEFLFPEMSGKLDEQFTKNSPTRLTATSYSVIFYKGSSPEEVRTTNQCELQR